MFDTLLASNAGSAAWTRPAGAAIILHAAVILQAVTGTATSSAVSPPPVRDTIRLELGQPAASKHERSGRSGPLTQQPIPVPPDLGDIPPAWPPLELHPSPFGARDWSALSQLLVEGEPGDSSHATIQPCSMTCVIDTEPGRGLPELAEDLRPRYPEMLRQAGVSGEVELEYVVLESGRVDSASVRVLASTHPAFSEAAREALQRARFKPAHRGSRPVPVTVRQTIHFVSR